MKKQNKKKKIWIAVSVAMGLTAAALIGFFFQHASVDIGGYTVVYYKNQCNVDAQALPADLESLKALPCLIRINWRERIASDLEQEYSYLPGRGIEKSRRIHKSSKE